MDERPYYPTLVRGRSSLPAAQQLDADVGTQGAATSCPLCLDPREGRLLWSGQPENGSPCTKDAPTFNSETFGDFLDYLLQATHGKIYLILDNAKWHKAKALKDFFIQNQDHLERIFLPPYSPELNPAERVWRITRRLVTHNRYFPSVGELKMALISHFTKWSQPNNSLKVLCANI